MKSQAFDSKRRLTNICCFVVGLGLVKLVFGAYIMAGGTLFDFSREEKTADPKAQALAKAREKQLLALKKANEEILVSQNGMQEIKRQNPDMPNTAKAAQANAQAPAQTAQNAVSAEKRTMPAEQTAQNELPVQDELLVQASLATINTMHAKNRRALMENAFEQSAGQQQDLKLEEVKPTYKKENTGFNFSLVGTAHAEEADVDAKDYLRPDQKLANTEIPVPTIEKPYDSPSVLSYKEAELNQKEEELLSLQEQMNSRMKELNQLENKLGDMVQQANSVEADKYSHLIATYAAMKPRKAAEALSTLDEKIAVRILTGMKSKQSGEIFSYMDPVQAARLSKAMTKIAGY